MLISFIIYGFTGLFLWWLGYIANLREQINQAKRLRTSFFTWEIIFSLLLFSIISGIRWNVGSDYLSYLNEYLSIANNPDFSHNVEYGFKLLTFIFSSLNIHFSFYFGLLALVQLFFVYYSFKNDRYILVFLGLLLIFGGQYHLWMNGIRQSIAACIFVFSIQFIVKRSFYRYLLTILLATSFHKSALLLIIFYFVPNKLYFKQRIFTISLLAFSIFAGLYSSVWIQKIISFDSLISLLGYDNYSIRLDYFINEMRVEIGFGPRRIISNLIIILQILNFSNVYNSTKDNRFLIFYNLSILGAIYFNIFANAGYIFLRPSYYFLIFTPIVSAYILNYFYSIRDKKNYLLFLFLFILSTSSLVISIIADISFKEFDYTNFKFFWNNHQLYSNIHE